VTIDGNAAVDVDLYSASRADDVEVWKSAALSPGEHVLVVRYSGRNNQASSGTVVAIDRVVVVPSTCSAVDAGTPDGGNPGIPDGSVPNDPGNGEKVARPSYNTGNGFFVVGNKLYDANGVEFRIRGLNKLHWDSDSPGIPKTRANTVRWNIDFNRSAADNVRLVQKTIDDHMVPMPSNWDGTCNGDTGVLNRIVDAWVNQAAQWKTLDRYMILNIANEWSPSTTVWRDAYIAAVKRLRDAGYLSTIAIDATGCGQDNASLVQYARAVFESDPQKNVIFDQHIYGNWWNGVGKEKEHDLKKSLDKLVATNLPMFVGEFGPGRNIGPSPTPMTPEEIMQACEERGLGWLAWAWDDNPGAGDGWFAMSKNNRYESSNDLTMFGKSVVENPTMGLLVLAKPATHF
jgi:mannan endo-1,4-beta-mannosidase